MTKTRIVVEIDNRSNNTQNKLIAYLNAQGWDWKITKFGPPCKSIRKIVDKKRIITIIPIERKKEFINIHINLFNKLHKEMDNKFTIGGIPVVREIAENAKLVLGYSKKTANTDIVRILYDIYEKEFNTGK